MVPPIYINNNNNEKNKTSITFSNQLADELHKPKKIHFKKRKVYAYSANSIWTADLMDMSSLAKYNNGYKYGPTFRS